MAQATVESSSLKDANVPKLLAILALNVAAFYLIQKSEPITTGDWLKLATGWISALPAGVGAALTGVINGLVSGDFKAKLAFLRWHDPYPGSRAFSHYAPNDPRIDMDALRLRYGPLPTDAKAQNVLWYRLYRTVATEPAVEQVHRQFLFARDYAFVTVVMIGALGVAAVAFMPTINMAGAFVGLLVVQWAAATRAAIVNGQRFVTTVLAHVAAR